MESPTKKKVVEFFFDVMCPYAWATSRWMVEVKKVRPVCIAWVPISNSILNEDNDDVTPAYKDRLTAGWAPARVFAAVALNYPDKVGQLYTSMGKKIHEENREFHYDAHTFDEIIQEALAETGLPADLFNVAHLGLEDEGSYEPQLRAFQKHAEELVGHEAGTPIVKIGEHAFFGPVFTRIPRGEYAGELFDATATLAKNDHFFELKRSRTERPRFDE